MKKISSLLLLVVLVLSVTPVVLSWQKAKKKEREFHQLTVYHFSTSAQEKMLDAYFQNALIPALHRQGIKNVGVFKSWANDTIADKLVYVFIPLRSLDDVVKLGEQLKKDEQYNNAGAAFLDADYKSPGYRRRETIVLRAFELAPQMQLPSLQSSKRNRVYELRSYESPTEKKLVSKIKMFNQGDEIGLFKRLNFNAVFYSEVVSGSKMPNLMYMTCFKNMQERDAHWKAFFGDTAWKKLSAMEEYKNNVSRAEISFLYPADYSDF